jgi:hypothetical protein
MEEDSPRNTINWLICIDIMIDISERGKPLSIFKEGKKHALHKVSFSHEFHP